MTDVQLITHNLLNHIKRLAAFSNAIYIMTAFLMKSGVKEILPALQQVSLRHADIKILTGDYMAITQPDTLALLHCELPNV